MGVLPLHAKLVAPPPGSVLVPDSTPPAHLTLPLYPSQTVHWQNLVLLYDLQPLIESGLLALFINLLGLGNRIIQANALP